jgi:hypothetical protein
MFGYEEYEIDENFLNAITEIEDQYYASKAIGVNPIQFVYLPAICASEKCEVEIMAPKSMAPRPKEQKKRTKKSKNPRKSLDDARHAATQIVTQNSFQRAAELTESISADKTHIAAAAPNGSYGITTLEHYTAAGDSLI